MKIGDLKENYRTVTKRDVLRFNHTQLIAKNLSKCRFRMAAQIYQGAKPISVAVNEIKTHPVFKKYGSHVVSIHAEWNAIIKARCDVSGSTLYVARYGGTSSMPCVYCRTLILEAGVKYIVYMLDNVLYKEVL